MTTASPAPAARPPRTGLSALTTKIKTMISPAASSPTLSPAPTFSASRGHLVSAPTIHPVSTTRRPPPQVRVENPSTGGYEAPKAREAEKRERVSRFREEL